MAFPRRSLVSDLIFFFIIIQLTLAQAFGAASCENVIRELNRELIAKIDEQELLVALRNLNKSGNTRLPAKFVTKGEAKRSGWKPGKDLWKVKNLKGKSIGGDRFGNRERQLPDGGRKWREADLDYKGGHRGAKRLLYSDDGLRMVTVDHYTTFTEVPACR